MNVDDTLIAVLGNIFVVTLIIAAIVSAIFWVFPAKQPKDLNFKRKAAIGIVGLLSFTAVMTGGIVSSHYLLGAFTSGVFIAVFLLSLIVSIYQCLNLYGVQKASIVAYQFRNQFKMDAGKSNVDELD